MKIILPHNEKLLQGETVLLVKSATQLILSSVVENSTCKSFLILHKAKGKVVKRLFVTVYSTTS